MSYKAALEQFSGSIWKPADQTRSYWKRKTWGIGWSENGEEYEDLNDWEPMYSSDIFREVIESGGYVLATVEDGCGGHYQIIFSADMEIQDNRFK